MDTAQIIDLIDRAKAEGLSFSLQDDKLQVKKAKGAQVFPGLIADIKAAKPQLEAFLRGATLEMPEGDMHLVAGATAEVAHPPLSFAQERLWFVDALQGSEHYHIPVQYRLSGGVNRTALQAALQQIVEDQAALRTQFMEKDGQAYQTLQSWEAWTLAVREESLAGEALDHAIRKFVKAPFHLTSDYLMRACLFQDGRDERLVVVFHHIAADGPSLGVFHRLLFQHYTEYLENGATAANSTALSYADYALAERNHLQGEVLTQKLNFWTDKLGGAPALNFPTDFQRHNEQSTRGGIAKFTLPTHLSSLLAEFCRQRGVTEFMVGLTVLKTLLYRYVGEQDISVGTPVANRSQEALHSLLGFFSNTLVIRTEWEGHPTFSQLLNQVRTHALEAYDHQDIPFAQVVNALAPNREMSQNPLFQVVYSHEPQAARVQHTTGTVGWQELAYDYDVAKYDLALGTFREGNEIQLRIEYCADLFLPGTMERMGQHFMRLLTAALQAPDTPIGYLTMLGAEEEKALRSTESINIESVPTTMLELWNAQVMARPRAAAVVSEGSTYTYAQVDKAANQLAHYLLDKGLKTGNRVGVCLPRTYVMLVTKLATMKAGGVYVPIDTHYPQGRRDYMVEDANAKWVVCEEGLPAAHHATQLHPGTLFKAIQVEPDTLPAVTITAGMPAYQIYTSGSTGQPKGVAVPHRALGNLIAWHLDFYQVSENSQATAMAGVGFDAHTWEIWPYLSAGACLHLIDDELRLNPESLAQYFASARITHAFVATAMAHELVSALRKQPNALQHLLTGGDYLAPLDVTGLPFQVTNNYGPTENAVVATAYVLTPEDAKIHPPIGRAIPNTTAFVMDVHDQLLPAGAIGELWLGGLSLAIGYYGKEALTEEKFVWHTWPDGTRERLYKTGDLVRRREDRVMDFVGRKDEQVKIRGFRIELGEIEAHLLNDPTVHHVVVMPSTDQHGVKRLVGYVVPEADYKAEETLAQLHDHLPDYMVPSVLITLDALPLTPNGKVDKKSLPPVNWQALAHTEFVAPEGPLETLVAEAFQHTLNLPQVSRFDNFFELGGDSIMAIQVVSYLKKAHQFLKVKQLFDNQTVRQLAQALQASQAGRAGQETAEGETLLLPVQQWFFEGDATDRHHFNQSFLLEVLLDLTQEQVADLTHALYRQHDIFRLRFAEENGAWKGQFQPYAEEMVQATVGYHSLAHLSEADSKAELEQHNDAYQAGFSLEADPLVKVVYYEMPGATNRLLVVAHHLLVDGVSWRILLADLKTLLHQLEQGATLDLGAKTHSVQAWANALSAYAKTPEVLSQLPYWENQLAGGTEPIAVEQAEDPDGVAYAEIELSEADTTFLLGAANEAHRTHISELLLAATYKTLEHLTGQPRVRIWQEGHGREELFEQLVVSETVGWFTSLFPMTIEANPQETAEWITQSKETLRSLPEKGIGFGLLQHYTQEGKGLSANLEGSFEVLLNYLGQFDSVLATDPLMNRAKEWMGANESKRRRRAYGMMVNASILARRLHIRLDFDPWVTSVNGQDLSEVPAMFETHLQAVIEHCRRTQLGMQLLSSDADQEEEEAYDYSF